jgi:hypothetical protein
MLCGSPFNLPQLSSSSPKASFSLALLDKIMAKYESEDCESEDSESEDSKDVEKLSRFCIHGYCWDLFEYLDLPKERLLKFSKAMWGTPSTSFFSPTINDLALGCAMLLELSKSKAFASKSGFALLYSLPEELHPEVLGYLPDCCFRSTIAVLALSTIMRPTHKHSNRTIQISTKMRKWTMGAYLTDVQSDDTGDIPNVSAAEFQVGTHGICAIRFHIKCEGSDEGEKMGRWIGGNASGQHEIWTGLIKNHSCHPVRNLCIEGDVSSISYHYEH